MRIYWRYNRRTVRRRILWLAPISFLVVSTAVTAVLSASSSTVSFGAYRNAYQPLPHGMIVNGQLMFGRLDDSQLTRVRISPGEAARIVRDDYGTKEPWRVVFESLGGYVNDQQIIHDWVGTESLIPKPMPAYIVRITGVPISSLGLGGAINHYWNVIVNAMTGRVIGSFSYD